MHVWWNFFSPVIFFLFPKPDCLSLLAIYLCNCCTARQVHPSARRLPSPHRVWLCGEWPQPAAKCLHCHSLLLPQWERIRQSDGYSEGWGKSSLRSEIKKKKTQVMQRPLTISPKQAWCSPSLWEMASVEVKAPILFFFPAFSVEQLHLWNCPVWVSSHPCTLPVSHSRLPAGGQCGKQAVQALFTQSKNICVLPTLV